MNLFSRNFICAAMLTFIAASSAFAAQGGSYRRGYYDDGAVGERRPDLRHEYRDYGEGRYSSRAAYDDAMRHWDDDRRDNYTPPHNHEYGYGTETRDVENYGKAPLREPYYYEDDRLNSLPPDIRNTEVTGLPLDTTSANVRREYVEENRNPRYCDEHSCEHCGEHHITDCGCDGWPGSSWKDRNSEELINTWGGVKSEHRSQLARDWEETYSELMPVEISNITDRALSIALVYYDKSVNDWICRGWVNVPPHGDISFGINHSSGKKLYYYVEHNGMHYSPKDSEGMDLSVTSGNFSYRQRDSRSGNLNLSSPYIAHFTAVSAPTDGCWRLNISR